MGKSKTIIAADLFAGAGGASTGLRAACDRLGYMLKLTAVNHWPVAVETHAANHPTAKHLCEDIESVNPRKAVTGGRLDLLLAGPSCTHHSTARGGKPVNDQQRSSVWCILRWASELKIDTILIENVREFMSYGPLGSNGRPLKSRKGETFLAFIAALQSLGYRVAWRVLNAADYGDPTTRERLFIQCRRGRRQIVWPSQTHSPSGETTLFGPTEQWRPAREIIDWAILGQSIFRRKRSLSPNTLARIAAGLRKFGGANAEPFLVLLNGGGYKGNGGARSVDRPVPTVTANGNHLGLCEPFILPPEGVYRGNAPRSLDDPIQTVLASRGGGHLVEPFVLGQQSQGRPRSVDQPLPTVATDGAIALIEPYIVPTNHGDTKGGNGRAYSVDRPMPTITTVDAWGLIEPFLTKYHGNGDGAQSVSDPLPTVDCRDRYGLVEPAINGRLDILFRMLQPHELAAAMSFPKVYVFRGNREQRVKQIGNAWAGKLSESLCMELLKE